MSSKLARVESVETAAVTAAAVPLLKLAHISRHYQSGDAVVRALDDVSLTIWPGEFLAIMGQSGSGKTTLMNLIGCLDQPTSGSYQVLGQETSRLDADELAALRRHTFGFIFQRYNLLATASAKENVEIPAVYAGVSKHERISRARALLAKLGLSDRCEHRPAQLSGGQQQRVAVARALMNDPLVILADEPTGALDSKSGQEVLALLRQLHAEGRTIILITHEENIAANAGRIIRIRDGRIAETAEATPRAASLLTLHHLDRADGAGLFTEIYESAKTALRALRVNLFRTALTLLGIIIGVASVVTMLAVGSGSKQKVLDQISAMGTNILSVRPGAAGWRGGGDIITLIPDDAEAIKGVANVEQVTPERGGRQTLRHGDTDYQTTVTGTWAEMPLIRDWPAASGSFFSARDLRSYAPVIVLGQTVVKNLFPEGGDPIGQYVRVKNVPFEVIGVLAAKGATMFGTDQDDAAFVPLTTGLIRLFGRAYVNSITVRVQDVKQIDQTQQAITALLKERHRTEDFNLRNMSSILDMANETQNTLTILLGAVAAISLLVGGIGVMNIMLVSVTERTREIGIRMATGARRRDIMLQFNTEASVVCIVGGILGVVIGVLTGLALRSFDIAVIFSVTPALLAFSCAFATGLVFGYLPARKAARLDPVIALASE